MNFNHKKVLSSLFITVSLVSNTIAQDSGNAIFPSGLVVNITQAPFNAVGDGVTDDTAAFKAAVEWSSVNTVRGTGGDITGVLYVPDGTYLVSDSIIAGITEAETGYINIQGQSRDGTIIKLAGGASGFGSAANPKPVISFFEGTTGHNDAFTNHVHNLTIDVNNNVGAVALKFVGNNTSSIRNVLLTGDGHIGLDLKVRLNGIGLIKDLTVEGYDIGVDYRDATGSSGNYHNGFAFKNLTLNNQSQAGILLDTRWVMVDRLVSTNAVPALELREGGAMATVLDSTFTGGSAGNSAIEVVNGGHVFVRNSSQTGYDSLIDDNGTSVGNVLGGEYASNVVASGSSPTRSLHIPAPELPVVPWDDPATWTIIDGQANGIGDDSALIQAAIDGGATTIAFSSDIEIYHTIFLRGNLRRIYGNWKWIRHRSPVSSDSNDIAIMIEDTNGPIVLSNFRTNWGTSASRFIVNENSSDVILQDLFTVHRLFYKSGTGDLGRVFLENTYTLVTQQAEPNLTEAPEGNLYWFINQEVYAWGLNPENTAPNMTVDGGTTSIRGFKFGEVAGKHFTIKNGANVELLGGVINVAAADPVAADRWGEILDTSNFSFSGTERATSRPGHPNIFEDSRSGTVAASSFPVRVGTNGRSLPLFVSREDVPVSAPLVRLEFVSNTGSNISIPSELGLYYQLEKSIDGFMNWFSLGDPVPGSGSILSFQDDDVFSGSANRVLYRFQVY